MASLLRRAPNSPQVDWFAENSRNQKSLQGHNGLQVRHPVVQWNLSTRCRFRKFRKLISPCCKVVNSSLTLVPLRRALTAQSFRRPQMGGM